MAHTTEEIFQILIQKISTIDNVQSIGLSGGKNPWPQVGEGDIDIFIYCDRIPELTQREAVIHQMGDLLQDGTINVLEEGHWGKGDFGLINGVETWLMYFAVSETLHEVDAIQNGEYPDKLDNYYYPIGRCAMLRDMRIFYDRDGFLHSLQQRLSEYPEQLAETLIHYHLEELEDTEDLERAAARNDLLFYHFAIDLAMDHFLQALFAMNRTYFPSRKRTLTFIEGFEVKPEQCAQRLLEVIQFGGNPTGIRQSYELWADLVRDLKKAYNIS